MFIRTDNTITIDNFDLAAALGATGYLGIKLDPTKQLALIQGNGTTVGATTANVWADVNFNPSSLAGKQSDITEGTGKTFTLNLNQGAKAGDTLTLALSSLADKFKAILGDSVVDANGAVITLAEGQTQVSFALIQSTGSVSADASGALTATYAGTGASSTATSNTWAINLKDTGPLTSTRSGDQRAKLIGIEIDTQVLPGNPLYNTYKWSATSWAADGTLTGGITEPGFSDVIDGTASHDKISGGSANDALSGGDGADDIEGGAGDDLIGGGAGSDKITGGDGNDYINSSATLNVQQRLSPTDSWSPPGTQTVKTQGAGWGIYIDTQSGSPVTVWSGSDNPAGAHARPVRLAGQKGLGRRMDRAWAITAFGTKPGEATC